MSGLYIHIPFCASRCIYCDFYSTTSLSLRNRYVDCLCREMVLRSDFFQSFDDAVGAKEKSKTILDTIYIGGGTPSQLSFDNIERIFQSIQQIFPSTPKEVTIEVNPDDVSPQMARFFKQIGINRVSMGFQTFDDERLKFLRRRHTSSQAINSIETFLDAGIDNISIDLMFGFPTQTVDDWQNDVQMALSLDVKHVSAYSLMYEEGTPLYRMKQLGEIKCVDDDTSADMYQRLVDLMKEASFEHYEISNFARKGFRSLHNSSYWRDETYLGIGAAAHSYNRKSRQWNVANIQEYMKSIENDLIPNTVETIDETTHYNDLITTALRTIDGLNLTWLLPEHRVYALKASKRYIDDGMMTLCDDRLALTERGMFLCDMIMSDLIIV